MRGKLSEKGHVGEHRGRQYDEVRAGYSAEIAAQIDGHDLGDRPPPRRGLGDRAADQAEPDDRDAPEERL
jgi:hypothetical protein